MNKVRTDFNYDMGADWMEKHKESWRQLEEQAVQAKAAGTLVGQYITEPFADGYAVYMVIKENRNTVRIKACTGLGDDWVIPYWGPEATIDKCYVEQDIKAEEKLTKVFR